MVPWALADMFGGVAGFGCGEAEREAPCLCRDSGGKGAYGVEI